ncbi:MAG: HAD family phosphatase [Candidatus Diapherotrites archaeon]|nr:HAD family phosphatase [Candidatus Diapherotrites archaeon]
MIDTIIFDAEGIVVDSEIIWDRGQEEFLRRRGFVYDRSRIKHLLTGKSLPEGVKILQREYGFKGDSEELAKERIEIVRELFRNQLSFISGFEEFYKKIAGKYKTCIATSMSKDLLEITDQRLGLSKLFNGNVFSIADVGYVSKPNPEIFLYSAKMLSSQPKYCLVIEDSPYGIEAAKRAGMRCIALTTTYERDKLKDADLVVDSYSQINLTNFNI